MYPKKLWPNYPMSAVSTKALKSLLPPMMKTIWISRWNGTIKAHTDLTGHRASVRNQTSYRASGVCSSAGTSWSASPPASKL